MLSRCPSVSYARYLLTESIHTVNGTLAIDLTKSWNVKDVEIKNTEYDGKQVLLHASLLVNESEGSFYTWGGRTAGGEQIRDVPELWKFKPDGEGHGEWTNETPETGDNFFSLKRSRDAAFASTSDKTFIFGGYTGQFTTREAEGAMSGYITVDMKTGEWTHTDIGPYSEEKTVTGGTAVFAPNLGPNGLVFVLGGVSDLNGNGDNRQDYLSFRTIHFMDPVTGTWYSQNTSGSEPAGRMVFCAGGAEVGKDGFDM